KGHERDAGELEELLAADNAAAKVGVSALPGLLDRSQLPGEPSPLSPIGATLDTAVPRDVPAVADGLARVQAEGRGLEALGRAAPRPWPTVWPVSRTRARHSWRWPWPKSTPPPAPGATCAPAPAARPLSSVPQPRSGASPSRPSIRANTGSNSSATPPGLCTTTPQPYVTVAMPAAPMRGCSSTRPAPDSAPCDDAAAARYRRDARGAAARVLAAAPCPGNGALRQHPEARYRRQPTDITAPTGLQRELLTAALDACAPRGVVAYSTCSPHYAETVLVVDDVLRGRAKTGRDDVEILDAASVLAEITDTPADDFASVSRGEGRFAQLWPHLHNTDGMFLALLRKAK